MCWTAPPAGCGETFFSETKVATNQQQPGSFVVAGDAVEWSERQLHVLIWKGTTRLSPIELLHAKRVVALATSVVAMIAEAGDFSLDQSGGFTRLKREANDILDTANADASPRKTA